MINLNLSTGNYALELNFQRIMQAERKLRCAIWPINIAEEMAPRAIVFRLFAAAANLTLDEAYSAVRSDEQFKILEDAILEALREYQPEVMRALDMITAGPKSLTSDPPITGKSNGFTPVSTSDSPEPTSEIAPSENTPPSITLGRREKQREKAVRLV